MNSRNVIKAAANFLCNAPAPTVEVLGEGLIHQTFKAMQGNGTHAIVLQAINTNVFKNPEDIVQNYALLYAFLRDHENMNQIPRPVLSCNQQLLYKDEDGNYWRATAFMEDSYSRTIADDAEAAFTVARSFALFTKSLAQLDIHLLKEIIPNFHNLSYRYKQFEDAVSKASPERLQKSTAIIAELRQRKKLVDFFEVTQSSPKYPSRVMHHDCKISNILFHKKTGEVICPVDLDTVMPGKFFSDLGDMIRSMACTVDENSTDWEAIDIRPAFYRSILAGYLEGIGNIFTAEEKMNIHYAGLILIYMQSIRFIADYLNHDVYYKTSYPEQNLNRSLNQLILLRKLEQFLQQEFSFTPYSL